MLCSKSRKLVELGWGKHFSWLIAKSSLRLFLHRRYNSSTKKISYEDDFHLPESGSLVQGVSVDPHSAVFGKNGQRLDEKREEPLMNDTPGLPDVTGYYHKNSNGGNFLSSFRPRDLEQSSQPLWPGGDAFHF